MKQVLSLSTIALAILAAQAFGVAQQAPQLTTVQATSTQELRTWDQYLISRERSGEFRRNTLSTDPLLPRHSIERYQQLYKGVPVWGADVVRESEGAIVNGIFGELAQDLSVDTEPGLSREQGIDAILAIAGDDGVILKPVELNILKLDSGETRLVYTAVIGGATFPARVFVDARSGREVLRISEIRTQAAIGMGVGVLGDKKKVSASKEGETFFADDRLRPPVLLTFDMRGNLARAMAVVDSGATLFPSDRASDGDNSWTEVATVDAHVHVGWTYDYYFARFGRRGLDDRDRPTIGITNAVSQQGALSLPASLSDWSINAFWCGSCGPGAVGIMFFGNGIPAGVFLTATGQNFTYLAGSLDVIAHELTHGVTSSTSGLIGQGESGALDEAFSDIMGTSVEFKYQPVGSGTGRADYLIGEDSVRALRVGSLDGIRSLADPGAYGDPDHYTRRNLSAADSFGVHTNSAIPSHAFYLAIEGGINRTSRLSVQGVGSANREQIERVFYHAFVYLLPRSARFTDARAATIQAARELYGAGSNVETAIVQAWTAVGVN